MAEHIIGCNPFSGHLLVVLQPPQRSCEDSLLGCVTNASGDLQSCTEDGEGLPESAFGVGFKPPELVRSKRRGGERPRKASEEDVR